MKKTLIILAAMAVFTGLNVNASFADETSGLPKNPPKEQMRPPQQQMSKEQRKAHMEAKRKEFNERLGLSEEQIQKAKEIRMAGREKMKPVMTELRAKHEQIRSIKEDAKLSSKAKDKKISAIKKELAPLEQKANLLREENEKEFVSILTAEQKIKYEEFKQEAIKRFQERRNHNSNIPLKK